MQLRRGGALLRLGPRPLAVLLHLIENRARLVTTAELKRTLWPDRIVVEDGSVRQCVLEVRRVLDDREREPPWIETTRGLGYRFAGALEQSADIVAPAQPCRRPDFLDRDAELARVRSVLQGGLRGERRLVFLHGPPGIGKTRAAAEASAEAAAMGFDVHVGRAHEGGGAPPFWPWIQILRGLLKRHGTSALQKLSGARALGALLPELGPEGSPAPCAPPGEDPRLVEAARLRLFGGMEHFLDDAATRQPLLLVLDDLHWADEGSLALLLFLARNAVPTRLVVLGTHRELASLYEDPRAHTLTRIQRQPASTSIQLAGIEHATVKTILARELLADPPDTLVDRVHAASGGNPFFVAEITRALADRAAGDLSSRVWIPAGIRDAIRARVAECSPRCRNLLRAASVLGARFGVPLLRQMLGASETTLLETMLEAERAHLLRPEPSGFGFVHGIARDALYEDLAGADRMRLHRDAGEALEGLCAADPTPQVSRLAHHFAEAAPIAGSERAIRYAREAAAHALAVSAYEDAARLRRVALKALDLHGPADTALRIELLVELGEALSAAHAPIDEVLRVFGEAMVLARARELWTLFARASLGSAGYLYHKSSAVLRPPVERPNLLRDSSNHLEEAERHLVSQGDASLRQRIALARAAFYYREGKFSLATPLLDDMLRSARLRGDTELTSAALLGRWQLEPMLDRIAERRSILAELAALDPSATTPITRGALCIGHAALGLQTGDRDAVDRSTEWIAGLRSELPQAEPLGCILRSLSAQLDGRLEDAEREAQQAARLHGKLNFPPEGAALVLGMQGWWLSVLLGRTGLIPAFEIAAQGLEEPRLMLARLYAACNRLDDARATFARVDLARLENLRRDDGWLFMVATAAEVCALVGDRDRAEPLLEQLQPYADLCVAAGWVVICTGALARPLGSLASLLGRWPEARELFALALEKSRALRSPVLRACTQLDYGRAFHDHPSAAERQRARRALASARRTAAEHGLHALEAAIERLHAGVPRKQAPRRRLAEL